MNTLEEFNQYRSQMNEKILDLDNKVLKRIFSLDSLTFQEGALNIATKELLGLACSLVLRCDDCVKYHLEKCKEAGLSKEEIVEAMGIANVIGGTIVIPHLRRAVEYLEVLEQNPAE
ncbi:carboxymuconolactone decarboxylase family protein [Rapidithrix thailandica]|uniref:Carboxymuconolactone decarboxylase family protein n=1 Tax=Rapidithrix thailandica TaxID=413964 RepID=A0AAW9SAF5_9BACT